MNMGFMFPGFGMLFGIVFVLIIPVVIFFGVKFMRGLTELSNKSLRKDESKTPKIGAQSFQNKIMKLAFNNGGILTVSDVVLATDLSIKQAEEMLNNMVDGYRVKMEVKDSGVIVYEFTELINKKEGTEVS